MKKSTKKPVKKKVAKRNEPKKLTMLDRLPKDQGERLELMIRMTERHTDKGMVDQAIRLRAQLEEWKKENNK